MPRHSSRSATRPWTLSSRDHAHRPRRLGLPGPLVAATIGAIALALVIPLTGPRSRVDDTLVGPGTAAGAEQSPTPGATEPPSAPQGGPVAHPTPDPGPDDVRAVRDAPHPAPPALLSGYRWPLPKGRLTQPFGITPFGGSVVDGQPFHDGLDIATFCGDRVVAAHDGKVLAVGRTFDAWIGWRGSLSRYEYRLTKKHLWRTLPLVVVIDDGNGYRSIYAHFGKTVVRRGQVVRAGELLGYEGASGHASGCHLHYGLFSPFERNTLRIDPKVAKKMLLPAAQTMRIDPLLVLPFRKDIKVDR